MLTPNSATLMVPYLTGNGPPPIRLPDGREVPRPHPEWMLFQLRWRWLLDSWEGGEAYRTAMYGRDLHGMPIRNLVRHKREYPSSFDTGYSPAIGRPVGTDQAAQATDDDYELRRARTPVPSILPDAVENHLARIYKCEVTRDGPPELEQFWEDVTGKGQDIDCWMKMEVAPYFMTLGCLDLLLDYPPAPKDVTIVTRAQEQAHGVDKLKVNYILPQNMVWWKLDRLDDYVECLIAESQDSGQTHWRFWDATGWWLFDTEGRPISSDQHSFGRVPILRVFDRKRPRYRNVGMSRYEVIAEIQREYYNRDSELILSDSTQAHPLLQGAEDLLTSGGDITIGPGYILPKKRVQAGTTVAYEGFSYIDPPKGAADSIRTNKHDLRDSADRAACLTKPAGTAGTSGNSVSQSGASKRLDASDGNDLLSKISESLAQAEKQLACFFLGLLGTDQQTAQEQVRVSYPKQFGLWTADELSKQIAELQTIAMSAGQMPETEIALIGQLVKLMLPGLDDDDYALYNDEIRDHVEQAARNMSQTNEAQVPVSLNGDTLSGNPTGGAPVSPTPPEPAADPELTNIRTLNREF